MYSYGFDYGDNFPAFDYYSNDLSGLAAFGGVFAIIALILFGLVLIFLAFAVVKYVLGSIGLYTIAKNRKFDNPWLAWIPIARDYYIGRIADDINATMAKRSNLRKIILALAATQFGVSFISGFITAILAAVGMAPLASVIALSLSAITYLATIAYAVIYFISLYKVYKEYTPSNAVLFEVLSIIFSIGDFFLFAIRNKKSGYQIWLEQNENIQEPVCECEECESEQPAEQPIEESVEECEPEQTACEQQEQVEQETETEE